MNDELYFEWLCNQVNVNPRGIHSNVLKLLHTVGFEYSQNVPLDENQIEHAIQFRERYSSIINDRKVSVLEVLVSMLVRFEENVYSLEDVDIINEMFIDILINLGLWEMNNNNFDRYLATNKIRYMLNREYNDTGSDGAIFTVHEPIGSMKYTHLWYQLNWYALQKYYS